MTQRLTAPVFACTPLLICAIFAACGDDVPVRGPALATDALATDALAVADAQLDSAAFDAQTADAIAADAGQDGFSGADGKLQEAAGSDASAPDVAAADAATPDAGIPDAGMPDVLLPDGAAPDAQVNDAATTDAAAPDAAGPDGTAPDLAIPDAAVPDATVPDTALSDTGLSDVGPTDAVPLDGGPDVGGDGFVVIPASATNVDVAGVDWTCVDPGWQAGACGVGTQLSPPLQPGFHVDLPTAITYADAPPASGTHRPMWAEWGSYLFLPQQRWLHNLEHGGAAFLYHPCAPKATVAALYALVKAQPDDDGGPFRWVMTPYPKLPSAIAVVTWGHVYEAACVNPVEIQAFLTENYRKAPEDEGVSGLYKELWLGDWQ